MVMLFSIITPQAIYIPQVLILKLQHNLALWGLDSILLIIASRTCIGSSKRLPRKTPKNLIPLKLPRLLGADGVIAQKLPDYEDRPEQLQMAFAVADAFNKGQLTVVEAGTGTGKSLAYLVPALLWARANQERVVISTRTINLQEQLIRKDLPFLQRATGIEFYAVLVKGRSNYFCLRRGETAGRELGLFDQQQVEELQQILTWAENTGDGSKEDLSFIPSYQGMGGSLL